MNATGSHPKRIGRRVFILVVLALAVVAFSEPAGVHAQGEHIVYLPVFHIAQSDTESAADSEYAIDTSEWSRYTSQAGGYSVLYPTGWSVGQQENTPKSTIYILPPVDSNHAGVFINYLGFEKYETEDLIPWLERYYSSVLGGLPLEQKVITPASFSVEGAKNNSEQAAFTLKNYDFGKGYFIANGRLVLSVETWSAADGSDELIRAIAESIEFDADSPTSVIQLRDSTQVRDVNLQEFIDRQQTHHDAVVALNERVRTGETPDELLQDDAVRERYEMLLEQKAYDIEQSDWLREKLEELYPELKPTPTP